ncbi:FAD-binding oxidoreductase [Nostoc ellipsosporum NOK]|nr:FAD-binding oxidoreductase [Nostoc ellipsosporum NOK]
MMPPIAACSLFTDGIILEHFTGYFSPSSTYMNLRSSSPYWLLRHGIIRSYPSLDRDIQADVAIMGGGISGALVAWQLQKAGLTTAVFDRRHTATGSTAASTALLQYEIDTPLHELCGMVGEKNATRSYLLCRDAIHRLKEICDELNEPGVFRYRPSFQYASFKSHVKDLEKEFTLRQQAGIELEWMDGSDVRRLFGFDKPAGLFSRDGAEADAYRITHAIFKKFIERGGSIYDNTEITDIRHGSRGVELKTHENFRVKAKHLVIACGYESQQYLPFTVQKLHSTFALASEPFRAPNFWHRNALIWETATPYLYMRTTSDNRIIVGGKDSPFTNPRHRDRALNSKAKALEEAFAALFPDLDFKTDFKWVGNFASTKDGLPYIGSVRQRPHTSFALGFGGNGITFSVLAADMIRDKLTGKKNKDEAIFSFDR